MFKKLTSFLVSIITLLSLTSNAQITVDPPFPTADEPVTVYFNAVGTGLEGYNGTIYAHTGLTIDENLWQNVIGDWGNNSTQPALTKIETDNYKLEITPSIWEFYGADETDDITEMSFVFRSADGSQQTSPDIFYNVYKDALAVLITDPELSPVIVQLNDTIHVKWQTNLSDSSFLYIDDEQVFAGTGSSFTYDIVVAESGTKWVTAVAKNETQEVSDSFYYYTRPEQVFEAVPDGIENGINIINDSTVILCLYAPMKEYVMAGGDFTNWELTDEGFMKLDEEADRFWVEISSLDPQTEYGFQYLVDGEFLMTDPYSEKILDPWNDKYIPESTYPNLKPYPEGKTDGLITVFQIDEVEYDWQNNSFDPPQVTDLVVYELLVRDFVQARNYQTLIDTIAYLKKLGVNAIELMPVNEFDGNLSWGYNPNHYFALDKYYGTKNAFKEFIDVCHGEGIAVILDVVFNHATGMSPYVRMYYNFELNRPADDSPFYNEIPKHDYNVFSDMNHEFEGSRDYIKRAITYWLEEYKVDGYRLDLSKGLTQKNTLGDVAAWGQYDQSRINIINDYAQTAWNVKPNAYFILEHFADNSEEKLLSSNGMMLWGNSNHNYNQATMGYVSESNFQWISYKSRGWSDPHVMGYMESHDEQRLMYKNVTYGNADGDYSTKDSTTALRRMALAANFFFTIPGPKLVWQFGELGYDYDIDYNGRTGEKPIRWDYLEDWRRRNLMYTYTSLIELKKEQEVFKTTDFDLDLNGILKKIRLTSPEMSVVILGNFDVKEGDITPNFYSTGTWYEFWTGDSIIVSDVNEKITLEHGEFRLYTDKKLQTPDFVGVDENIAPGAVSDFVVYPNPATDQLNLKMHMRESSNIQIELHDIQGRMVKQIFEGRQASGLRSISAGLSDVNQGLYFVVIQSEGQRLTKKLMIN